MPFLTPRDRLGSGHLLISSYTYNSEFLQLEAQCNYPTPSRKVNFFLAPLVITIHVVPRHVYFRVIPGPRWRLGDGVDDSLAQRRVRTVSK